MARDDEDAPWARQLLVGLGVLVAVSLLIGAVISVVAVGAARVTGIGSGSGPAAEPTLYIPSGEPTTRPSPYPAPTRRPSASPSPSPESSPSASPTHKKKPRKRISLQGFPNQVSPGQRINLTGVYKGGEGATLQVQRYQNGWADFPVTASVSGGIFNTYVMTGRTGKNRFRMLDKASGRHSNPVSISVG